MHRRNNRIEKDKKALYLYSFLKEMNIQELTGLNKGKT